MSNQNTKNAHKKAPGSNEGDSKQQRNSSNISAASQRARLLAALMEHPVDTFQARNEMNIMSPPARIMELIALGHKIESLPVTLIDSDGVRHPRCARYVLSALADKDGEK